MAWRAEWNKAQQMKPEIVKMEQSERMHTDGTFEDLKGRLPWVAVARTGTGRNE